MHDPVEELMEAARTQLDRLKGVVEGLGLKSMDLEPSPFGVGIGIPWADTRYATLSIGGGADQIAYVTSGALKDIAQDRAAALEACNTRTQGFTAFPFFLHDAEAGWDILVQQTFPVELLVNNPDFCAQCLSSVAMVAEDTRPWLAEQNVHGEPYMWTTDDVQRLLTRSLM